MKIAKILLSSGVIALASVAAQAASIPALTDSSFINSTPDGSAANDGDLVLGFYNSAVNSNLIVDIGPATYYYSTALSALGGTLTPGTTYTVDAYKSSDLTAVFGSNATSSSTQWAVIGGNGNGSGPTANTPGESLWTTADTTKGKPQASSQTAQTGTSVVVDTLTNQMYNGTSTLSSSLAQTISSSGAASFNLAFNTVQASQSGGVVVTGTTAATSSLDLWYLPSGGNAVDLGTFTLSSTGLTFTTFSAIPEPSTYAAILGALTIGFVALRRRFSKAV